MTDRQLATSLASAGLTVFMAAHALACTPAATNAEGATEGQPMDTDPGAADATSGADASGGDTSGATGDTAASDDPCETEACSEAGLCAVVDGSAQCQCDVGFQPEGLTCVENGEPTPGNYPLEIIQPRPNLDTTNRYYKAYPGLEYNVRLAVTGGEFPFRYNLEGPAGMTIDARGEIRWPDPPAAATAYAVAVDVTDANFNITSVTWDITVTDEGFRFIDAVNGTSAERGGRGTFENPWQSIKDMYEGDDQPAKGLDSYAGEFLYWREGTYPMNAYLENNGTRVPLSGRKPLVWLAYPGENPVLDLALGYISLYGMVSNAYFDGFEINVNGNARGMGLTVDSNASHITFRNNKMHGITGGFVGGNNALIFIARASAGEYYSIQDNEMFDVDIGYGVLGYAAKNVVIEDNFVHGIGSHGLGPKEGTAMWFIRSNVMSDNGNDSIGLQYSDTGGILSGDIEISYNLVAAGGGRTRINSNRTTTGLPVHIFRNTFLGYVQVLTATSDNGPFRFYDNVIVDDGGDPDHIQREAIEDPSRVEVFDNLVGVPADNIVDADGELMPEFAKYLGLRGHVLEE